MFFLYLTSCKVARKRIALIIALLFIYKSSQNDRNLSKEMDDIFDTLLCRSRSHKLWPMSLGPVRAAGLKRRRSVAAWRPRSCAKFLKLSQLITGKYGGYENDVVVCTCKSCDFPSSLQPPWFAAIQWSMLLEIKSPTSRKASIQCDTWTSSEQACREQVMGCNATMDYCKCPSDMLLFQKGWSGPGSFGCSFLLTCTVNVFNEI